MYIPVWGLLLIAVVIIYLISSKASTAKYYKAAYYDLYKKYGKRRWEFEG